jgi:hypothetical protein
MKRKDLTLDPRIMEEQLKEAKRALFMANSVKKIRFLQRKINYLQDRLKKFDKHKRLS